MERLSIRAIHHRTGLHRETIRRALASDSPPRYLRTTGTQPSKLDSYREEIARLLRSHPGITNTRIRELIGELGYDGGKTILDDYLREIRPVIVPKRTYQRTVYRPGEIAQFDLWEPKEHIPVGYGQQRRGWVVTCELGYSRAGSGALVFSKQAPDILWGMARCLGLLGGLPETLVWDREGAMHADRGNPSDALAAFCGQLSVGWLILAAADPESKGALERNHRYMRTNFESARSFSCNNHFQVELDDWFEHKANSRFHTGIRDVPARRLIEERKVMRPLPAMLPDTDRRFVIRVPQQPYLRIDTNDYSVDPVFAGRRVEVRVSQQAVTATALDTGEIAAAHKRVFAKHLTLTDRAHQAGLDRLRGKRVAPAESEVQIRPLSVYDALIPA